MIDVVTIAGDIFGKERNFIWCTDKASLASFLCSASLRLIN